MGRRKKSGADEIVELVSEAPWWLGATFAAIFFFIVPGILAGNEDQLMRSMGPLVSKMGAGLCAIGAVVSLVKGGQRKRLLDQQRSIESIRELSWQEFELLVGEAFRLKGYTVEENGGGGADGGVDLTLFRRGKKTLVQCKRWKKNVGVSTVRELYGVMSAEHAPLGIVVSCSGYTREAENFADGKAIELINGETLAQMVADVQKDSSKTPEHVTPQAGSVRDTAPASPPPAAPATTAPACPKCGAEMVLRTAKKGANAGSQFWGCSGFPKCRGIVSLK